MKFIKVPYTKKAQKFILKLCTVTPCIGVVLIYNGIDEVNSSLFLIGITLSIPPLLFLWLVYRFKIFIQTSDTFLFESIEDLNDKGFTIQQDINRKRIQWCNVKSIELVDSSILLIKLFSNEILSIKNNYVGWYVLLKSIPQSKLESNDIPEYINDTFSKLRTCRICGMQALLDDQCLHCRSRVYNKDLKLIFDVEDVYIKEAQLEWFSIFEIGEVIELECNDAHGFIKSETWIPMVTYEEVLEYSRHENDYPI